MIKVSTLLNKNNFIKKLKKKMKKNSHNPTLMIKAKFSNSIHRILEPKIEIKKSERWKHRDKYDLTDEEKIETFDKILKLHRQSSYELTNYQYDRRYRNKVEKDRIERGYYEKKSKKIV